MTLICGNDAGEERVRVEDLAVARERLDALLDPRAARVVEADDRKAGPEGALEALADLRGVELADRASGDREVLGERVDSPTVHPSLAGHDSLSRERPGRPARSSPPGPRGRTRRSCPCRGEVRGARAPSASPGGAAFRSARLRRPEEAPASFDRGPKIVWTCASSVRPPVGEPWNATPAGRSPHRRGLGAGRAARRELR